MNHTPGPWKQDKIVGTMVWAGEMHIADIRGWGHLTGRGAMHLSKGDAIAIQSANAQLIAAAPAMLEALEEATAMLKAANLSDGLLTKQLAAIALARGDTNEPE